MTIKLNKAQDEEEIYNNFLELQRDKPFKCKISETKKGNRSKCSSDSECLSKLCQIFQRDEYGVQFELRKSPTDPLMNEEKWESYKGDKSNKFRCSSYKMYNSKCDCDEECTTGNCRFSLKKGSYRCKN